MYLRFLTDRSQILYYLVKFGIWDPPETRIFNWYFGKYLTLYLFMTCHDSPTLCEFENQWEMQPSDKTAMYIGLQHTPSTFADGYQ